MRFLLLPGNNALSHLAKALAVREALLELGHEVELAVANERSSFLESLGIDHRLLPDIQQADGGPSPSFSWFKRPRLFEEVTRREEALIREIRPDRVLAIFRFTTAPASALADVPCDTLGCGCMLPVHNEVLGFAPGEAGREEQAAYLDFFFGFAAERASEALSRLGLPAVSDVRELLLGERTFLWDVPEFMPVSGPGIEHVGPLAWSRWPGVDERAVEPLDEGLALVGFGTACPDPAPAAKLVGALLEAGWRVAFAAGGREGFLRTLPEHPRLRGFRFAPIDELLERAAVAVCHGGQQTVFEALRREVPVAVMPFQPEQAHNGVCLERLGVGARLVPAVPSRGESHVYSEALERLDGGLIAERIGALSSSPKVRRRLVEMRRLLESYDGARTLAARLEAP